MVVREALSAGATLDRIADTSEMPAANSSTFLSRLTGTALMAGSKLKPVRTSRIPMYVRNRPKPPPTSAITTPSVSSWRTTRARLAPSDIRIASSFCRLTARVSRSPATFAQAMRSTNPTTVMINASAGPLPKLRTRKSGSIRTDAPQCFSVLGKSPCAR